jgi:hypothetical protein
MKTKCISTLDRIESGRYNFPVPTFECDVLYDYTISDKGDIMIFNNINVKITKKTYDQHFIDVSELRDKRINEILK